MKKLSGKGLGRLTCCAGLNCNCMNSLFFLVALKEQLYSTLFYDESILAEIEYGLGVLLWSPALLLTYLVMSYVIHLCMHCCRHCYNGQMGGYKLPRNFQFNPRSKKTEPLGKNLIDKNWQASGSIQSVCIFLSVMVHLHLVVVIKAMISNCS